MKSNKLVAALTLCGALFAATLRAAPILSDIVFVVDESGSMSTVQQNLRNNIGRFASILTGTGQVNANYGLVGYGSGSVAPRMVTDLTDNGSFFYCGRKSGCQRWHRTWLHCHCFRIECARWTERPVFLPY